MKETPISTDSDAAPVDVGATALLALDLLRRSRDGVIPTTGRLNEVERALSKALEQVPPGSRQATELHYVRSRLLLVWGCLTMLPGEATNIYMAAFHDAYEALSQELVHAWDGDRHAREALLGRVRAIAVVCDEASQYLRTDQFQRAAALILRASSLIENKIELAAMTLSVGNSMALSGLQPFHEAGVELGLYRGEDSVELIAVASLRARVAAQLAENASIELLTDPTATVDQLHQLVVMLDEAESPGVVLLTFASHVPLETLRELVLACQFAAEVIDGVVEKVGAEAAKGQLAAAMELYLSRRAYLLLDFIHTNSADLEADALSWLQELRKLPGTFWLKNRPDLCAPRDPHESKERTGPEALTHQLSNLEKAITIEWLVEAAQFMNPDPGSAEQESGVMTLEESVAVVTSTWVMAVRSLPPELASLPETRLTDALATLFADLEGLDAIDIAAQIVELARQPASVMPLTQLVSRAIALDRDRNIEPAIYIRELGELIDLTENLTSDHERFDAAVGTCLEVVYRATTDQRFRQPPASHQMVAIARRLQMLAPPDAVVRARHAVLRTLWMEAVSSAEYEEVHRIALATLEELGYLPTDANLGHALQIIESARFVLGVRRRTLLEETSSQSLRFSEEDRALATGLLSWAGDERVDPDLRRFALALHTEFGADLSESTTPAASSDEEFTHLLKLEPTILVRRVAGGHTALTEGQLDQVRELLRSSQARDQPHLTPGTWADLITPNAARRLNFTSRDRLNILRTLVASHDLAPHDAASIVSACVHVSDLLFDIDHGHEANQLSEHAASVHLGPALESDGRLPALAPFLHARASQLVNEVVNESEWAARVATSIAAYAAALWDNDPVVCALTAYITGEYYRLHGLRRWADWWYAMYDQWVETGALDDPAFQQQKQLIAQDRASTLVRRWLP